jgi:hypothetical protein
MSDPPPPSKNRENQDSATLTRSQPSTSEEVAARVGRPTTSGPDREATDPAEGGTEDRRRDDAPVDQSTQPPHPDASTTPRP